MMIPPILEIYALWHPGDAEGATVANALIEHFHGTTYSGLVGGAVEVYVRSEGWNQPGGPPRPMPFMEQLPHGLQAPAVTAVVPVLGTQLARALQEDAGWEAYVSNMTAQALAADLVGVFPIQLDAAATSTLPVTELFSHWQFLREESAKDPAILGRELAQAIAQLIGDPLGERLRVFISHTKRHSPDEEPDEVDELVTLVRQVIGSTHLASFFDEADIQPGTDWYTELTREAAKSGLLMIRTDLYSGREWCQREVLVAKRASMPIVALYATRRGEERGSFLMDHIPSVPLRDDNQESRVASIEHALNVLVDEALKRALWNLQCDHLKGFGFDWLPAHAPELVTLTPWIRDRLDRPVVDQHVIVMHPDPPLGPDETSAIDELFAMVGMGGIVDVVTPRTFASRGGRIDP
jgi:TIR domain-containing protein